MVHRWNLLFAVLPFWDLTFCTFACIKLWLHRRSTFRKFSGGDTEPSYGRGPIHSKSAHNGFVRRCWNLYWSLYSLLLCHPAPWCHFIGHFCQHRVCAGWFWCHLGHIDMTAAGQFSSLSGLCVLKFWFVFRFLGFKRLRSCYKHSLHLGLLCSEFNKFKVYSSRAFCYFSVTFVVQ